MKTIVSRRSALLLTVILVGMLVIPADMAKWTAGGVGKATAGSPHKGDYFACTKTLRAGFKSS